MGKQDFRRRAGLVGGHVERQLGMGPLMLSLAKLAGECRALVGIYPLGIFDALCVNIRDADSRMVKNTAVYIALGANRARSARFVVLRTSVRDAAQFRNMLQ